MVRGTFIDRGASERVTLADALDRYPIEVSPTKKPSTAASDQCRARVLKEYLGRYSLVALTPGAKPGRARQEALEFTFEFDSIGNSPNCTKE